MRPTDPNLSLSLASLKQSLQQPSLVHAASGLAQGLLNDLRRKTPILEAYLTGFPAQEASFSAKLAAYLYTLNITSNAMLSETVRRDCLSLLGVVSSQLAVNRRVLVLLVTQT